MTPNEQPLPEDSRIRDLLEEALDSNSSPEEVCRDYPELLPEVRAEWERVRIVEAEIDALFPKSGTGPEKHATRVAASVAKLPDIPGHKVESVLGHGGMGVVYRAYHVRFERPVAIKMLLSGEYAGPQEKSRFEREAKAVAALRHHNVVQVYEVGDFEGRPYFTMELVEGETLSKRLSGAPLRAADAAIMAATLADAVQAAHDRGIVHRDLKPANILLTADGTPKISDFGLARRLDEDAALTIDGARIGTPSYMAPEQAMGKGDDTGPSVDIYSLGALLYEMLTGRPPFRAESPAETQRQVISEEPAPPRQLNAKIPRDLETICLKCLSKEPRHRYESAAALAAELGRFQRGEAITARRTGYLERGVRWMRRKPALTAFLACALLLLVVAVLAGFREWNLANTRKAEFAKWATRLEFVLGLQDEGRFAEARAILGRVPDAGSAELRRQIAQAQSELSLVEALDSVRMSRIESGSRDFDRANVEGEYRKAFRNAGIDVFAGASAEVAARIAATNVKKAITAAIDDWSHWTSSDPSRSRLLEINRLADPDPWRNRVRNPGIWSDASALTELADTANTDEQSAPLLLMLARQLEANGLKATDFYRRVQMSHPDDFFANFTFAETLQEEGRVDDAIGYYRAALVVRPRAVAAYVNLGAALNKLGRTAEAMDYWRQSLSINSAALVVHLNLASAALNQDRLDDAIKLAEGVLQIAPQSGHASAIIGQALLDRGDHAAARPAIQRAVDLLPQADAYHALVLQSLKKCERRLELEGQVEAILRGEARPTDDAHLLELGELLLAKKRFCEAAGLYRRGFAGSPSLDGDELAKHHHYGACAALGCAATVRSESNPNGDSPEIWRRLALDWLKSGLSHWTKRANQGTPEDLAWVARHMAFWSHGNGLATIREAVELDRLPESERAEVMAFWQSVEKLHSIAAGH